jgi:hypothetical protein
LCVDYDTQWNKIQYQNWEQCDALNKQWNSYLKHYQWLWCQNHYHTWSWDGGHVCRADCTLINRNTNRTEYILHQTTRTACKTKSESCENGAGKCECATLVCDDWKWKKDGAVTNEYKYTDCVLNDFSCNKTNYNVTEAEKTAHQPESIYGESCDSYEGKSDKVTCEKTQTDYKLTNCLNWDRETWFHTEDNKFCTSNYDERDCTKAWVLASLTMHWRYIVEQVPVYWHGTAYNVWSWATPDNCAWECYPNNNYHLEDGDCQSNTRGVDCNDHYAAELPNNAHWRGLGVQTWNGAWNDGRWLKPARNSCVWECDDGYVESDDWTSCVVLPESCSATTYTYWNCSYSIPSLSHEWSQTVSTSTEGYNWSVKATCNNWTLSYSDKSCSAIPESCSATTYTYGNCSYSIPTLSHGWSQTVSTSTAGYAGSVKATCSNWTLSYSDKSCSAQSCWATTYTYGSCSYSIPALSNWWSQTVSTSTVGYKWSVKASCSKWTLSYSDKSCTAIPESCWATTYTYSNCSYSIPALSDGWSQTVSTSTAW